jgi:hypothetical protein
MNVVVVKTAFEKPLRKVVRKVRDFAVAVGRSDGNDVAKNLQRRELIVGGVIRAPVLCHGGGYADDNSEHGDQKTRHCGFLY